MLSGGEALEAYAVKHASSAISALAKRMPSIAHLKKTSGLIDIEPSQIQIDDKIMILPHEIAPVDGVVIEGNGSMDESFLTGEPYEISKLPGSHVISGALNQSSALLIKASRHAKDSRYASIMKVMEQSEKERPQIRRLGDSLGALYTPIALLIAGLAWYFSGETIRFLSVLVVATPCPLLISIPVSILGSISLAAKRGIIIRDPSALEQADACKTIIFDKTGTLTVGKPTLKKIITFNNYDEATALSLLSSVEQYSKHPLAHAVVEVAQKRAIKIESVTELTEPPGQGLTATIGKVKVNVTGRAKLSSELQAMLPPRDIGLECILLVDSQLAGLFSFQDQLRADAQSFVEHIKRNHAIEKVILLSGDQALEVEYVAKALGISEIHHSQSPEDKVKLVNEETRKAKTIFVGDGINDAPALLQATVGIAFGQANEATVKSAKVTLLDSSVRKVDEFIHIGRRLRKIALQSSVGGMIVSIFGMLIASFGFLTPVAGAIIQEVIDLVSVLNALRTSRLPKKLSDY